MDSWGIFLVPVFVSKDGENWSSAKSSFTLQDSDITRYIDGYNDGHVAF